MKRFFRKMGTCSDRYDGLKNTKTGFPCYTVGTLSYLKVSISGRRRGRAIGAMFVIHVCD